MTIREIAKTISKRTGYNAVDVDVHLLCYEAQVRPYDVESIGFEFGKVVLYLKGSWTVHGDITRIPLNSPVHYVKIPSNW